MSDYRKSKYIFLEKFFREFFDNWKSGKFLDIDKMYSDFTNEIRAVFLGVLLIFEKRPELFEIGKEIIINVLKNVLTEIINVKPNSLRTFQNYIDFHKDENGLTESINLTYDKKENLEEIKQSFELKDKYRKWSKKDFVMAKTELELALIFINQIEFTNKFYSFVEKFEDGLFLQYLDDIKDTVVTISNHLKERINLEKNSEFSTKTN